MKQKRTTESGFALLIVFAMSAAIALMLYMELPRQSFERQRDKEQLLIDRGEQYRQAIRIYFRKFKQYPTSLDALKETNGVHFLRHEYKDPMTGKNEWRLIHAGPGGIFTDSKTLAPPNPNKDKDKDKVANTFITEGPAIGSTGPQQGTPTALYKRERGGTASGAPAYPGSATPGVQPYPGAPTDPNAQPQPIMPGVPGMPTVSPGMVGQNIQQPYPVGQPGMVGQSIQQPYPAGQPGMPQQVTPGTYPSGYPPGVPYVPGQFPPQGTPGSTGSYPVPPGYPPLPANSQQGGYPQPYYSTQPGVGGAPSGTQMPFPQPGTSPAPNIPGMPGTNPGQGNPATDMIQRLLTTPRPGGLSGTNTTGFGTVTGGIAGVASKLEEDSIKVYNDQEAYDYWEFIYDPRKDVGPGQQTGMTGQQPPNTGQKPTQGTNQWFNQNPSNTTTPPPTTTSPFGNPRD